MFRAGWTDAARRGRGRSGEVQVGFSHSLIPSGIPQRSARDSQTKHWDVLRPLVYDFNAQYPTRNQSGSPEPEPRTPAAASPRAAAQTPQAASKEDPGGRRCSSDAATEPPGRADDYTPDDPLRRRWKHRLSELEAPIWQWRCRGGVHAHIREPGCLHGQSEADPRCLQISLMPLCR